MKLLDHVEDLDELGVRVVALSQEDKDLESASKMAQRFDGELPFDLVYDLDRAETEAYDRTNAYLIDEHGVVQQVFPMLIHFRPSWEALVREAHALDARTKK